MTNETTHDEWLAQGIPLFLKACELAEIEPTRRQASKWRRSTGAAWRKRHEAKAALATESGG